MRSFAYASAIMLALGLLAFAADTAVACGPPPSGTGVTTCNGGSSAPAPTLTDGPVCVNTLCPGIESQPTGGTCATLWANNQRLSTDICVPVSV